MSSITHEGVLSAKGAVLKRWKQKRFVLRSDGSLYDMSEGAANARVHAFRDAVVRVDATVIDFALQITDKLNGGRTHELRCASRSEWRGWVDALRAVKWNVDVVLSDEEEAQRMEIEAAEARARAAEATLAERDIARELDSRLVEVIGSGSAPRIRVTRHGSIVIHRRAPSPLHEPAGLEAPPAAPPAWQEVLLASGKSYFVEVNPSVDEWTMPHLAFRTASEPRAEVEALSALLAAFAAQCDVRSRRDGALAKKHALLGEQLDALDSVARSRKLGGAAHVARSLAVSKREAADRRARLATLLRAMSPAIGVAPRVPAAAHEGSALLSSARAHECTAQERATALGTMDENLRRSAMMSPSRRSGAGAEDGAPPATPLVQRLAKIVANEVGGQRDPLVLLPEATDSDAPPEWRLDVIAFRGGDELLAHALARVAEGATALQISPLRPCRTARPLRLEDTANTEMSLELEAQIAAHAEAVAELADERGVLADERREHDESIAEFVELDATVRSAEARIAERELAIETRLAAQLQIVSEREAAVEARAARAREDLAARTEAVEARAALVEDVHSSRVNGLELRASALAAREEANADATRVAAALSMETSAVAAEQHAEHRKLAQRAKDHVERERKLDARAEQLAARDAETDERVVAAEASVVAHAEASAVLRDEHAAATAAAQAAHTAQLSHTAELVAARDAAFAAESSRGAELAELKRMFDDVALAAENAQREHEKSLERQAEESVSAALTAVGDAVQGAQRQHARAREEQAASSAVEVERVRERARFDLAEARRSAADHAAAEVKRLRADHTAAQSAAAAVAAAECAHLREELAAARSAGAASRAEAAEARDACAAAEASCGEAQRTVERTEAQIARAEADSAAERMGLHAELAVAKGEVDGAETSAQKALDAVRVATEAHAAARDRSSKECADAVALLAEAHTELAAARAASAQTTVLLREELSAAREQAEEAADGARAVAGAEFERLRTELADAKAESSVVEARLSAAVDAARRDGEAQAEAQDSAAEALARVREELASMRQKLARVEFEAAGELQRQRERHEEALACSGASLAEKVARAASVTAELGASRDSLRAARERAAEELAVARAEHSEAQSCADVESARLVAEIIAATKEADVKHQRAGAEITRLRAEHAAACARMEVGALAEVDRLQAEFDASRKEAARASASAEAKLVGLRAEFAAKAEKVHRAAASKEALLTTERDAAQVQRDAARKRLATAVKSAAEENDLMRDNHAAERAAAGAEAQRSAAQLRSELAAALASAGGAEVRSERAHALIVEQRDAERARADALARKVEEQMQHVVQVEEDLLAKQRRASVSSRTVPSLTTFYEDGGDESLKEDGEVSAASSAASATGTRHPAALRAELASSRATIAQLREELASKSVAEDRRKRALEQLASARKTLVEEKKKTAAVSRAIAQRPSRARGMSVIVETKTKDLLHERSRAGVVLSERERQNATLKERIAARKAALLGLL
jgi:hypothetical protein